MVDLNSVVAGMKGAEGLSTADVNSQAAASSPVANIQPNAQNTSPAQQTSNTAAILQNIAAPPAQAQSEVDRALAAKDQAITASQARIDQLSNALQSQTEKMEQVLTRLTPEPVAQRQDTSLPGLPDDLEALSADDQLRALKTSHTALKDALETTLKQRDNELRNLLGPMAKEVGIMKDIKDKSQVMENFPNYDWDTNETAINQYRAELNYLPSAVEAASVIAARTDPSMLLQPEAVVPHVEQSLPSTRAAAGQVATQAPSGEDVAHREALLRSEIHKANMAGNSSTSSQLADALLKSKYGRIFTKG